jgi:malate synthase
VAREVFDRVLGDRPNQKDRLREEVRVGAEDLLSIGPRRAVTEQGVRNNINVGIQYVAAWLNGLGAVAIYNLMEDAATAEISRAQLWQWIHHNVELEDGKRMTRDLYERFRHEELQGLLEEREDGARLQEAAELLDRLVLEDEFREFLTLPGYERLG